MATEHDEQGRKYTALYVGVVVDNADPERLGRARVRIEGLVEKSAWAFPLGHMRGGAKRLGAFAAPPPGAEVGVFFAAGDTDHPYFLPGAYGLGEVPGPVGGYRSGTDAPPPTSAAEATHVTAFEGERYVVVLDERAGKERAFLRDKVTGDELLLDGVSKGVTLSATTALTLKATGLVSIEALQVLINGRLVKPAGPPI